MKCSPNFLFIYLHKTLLESELPGGSLIFEWKLRPSNRHYNFSGFLKTSERTERRKGIREMYRAKENVGQYKCDNICIIEVSEAEAWKTYTNKYFNK